MASLPGSATRKRESRMLQFQTPCLMEEQLGVTEWVLHIGGVKEQDADMMTVCAGELAEFVTLVSYAVFGFSNI